jgi:fatty-acyl-CoA synthase
MCYTSGTTGDPKGVVYSHRSPYLHSMTACTPAVIGLDVRDRVLAIVPQFHANAWGMPYAAFLSGAALLMPDRFLQAEPLAAFIEAERPTVSAAVPTVWADLLRYGDDHDLDVSSLRFLVCGGAALPRSLMERFEERHGLRLIQGWGMTETSPVGAVGHPPADAPPGSTEEMDWRAKTGRVVPGVELRIVGEDGTDLPWDGASVGEIEVRGPWVTTSYWQDDAPDKFRDGWLRTGDVGSLTANGYLQITDRAKDVIKSGGEWISSVELENALAAHPGVLEAAVIGIPRSAVGRAPTGLRRRALGRRRG